MLAQVLLKDTHCLISMVLLHFLMKHFYANATTDAITKSDIDPPATWEMCDRVSHFSSAIY